MDRSPAVFLLLANAGVLTLCAALESLWTTLWVGALVMAAMDPTAPQVLLWFFGGGIVIRLAMLLLTAVAVLFQLAAAGSLRRDERRFVLVAAMSAMFLPIANMTLGMLTMDLFSIVWILALLLGVAVAVTASASIQGTHGVQRDEW